MTYTDECRVVAGRSGMTTRLFARCLTLALAVSACRSGSEVGTVMVTDSAGVEIVENEDYAWPEGQAWRLADDPILDIGLLEGEDAYQLFDVVGALRLTDGGIVVANAGSFELRFYDANGTHLFSVGREGGGPGV